MGRRVELSGSLFDEAELPPGPPAGGRTRRAARGKRNNMQENAMRGLASRRVSGDRSDELAAIGVPLRAVRPELDSARYWASEMARAAAAADIARRDECHEKMMLSLRAMEGGAR